VEDRFRSDRAGLSAVNGRRPGTRRCKVGWQREGTGMKNKIWLVLALVAVTGTVSGCVPVLIGAAGAVAVDEAIEQNQGGDGLF